MDEGWSMRIVPLISLLFDDDDDDDDRVRVIPAEEGLAL